jgi:uncharacterized OsmC-like protein
MTVNPWPSLSSLSVFGGVYESQRARVDRRQRRRAQGIARYGLSVVPLPDRHRIYCDATRGRRPEPMGHGGRGVASSKATSEEADVDLRTLQRPLKERYRTAPDTARITLRAHGAQADVPIACSVDLGRAVYQAQAHSGVGGAGTAACSGDLLLGALAACAQLTCQMVAAALAVPVEGIEVTVEGDLDLRGTLGVAKDVPAGFQAIRVAFNVQAPEASAEQLASLAEKTERYCTVFQTLVQPPPIRSEWQTP